MAKIIYRSNKEYKNGLPLDLTEVSESKTMDSTMCLHNLRGRAVYSNPFLGYTFDILKFQ